MSLTLNVNAMKPAYKKNQGFTLIEALISVVVLAIGLLGLAGLQAASISNNQSAYNRSQATQLAYDIADRIRANAVEANKFSTSAYITVTNPSAQATCKNTTGCSAALMAQNDLYEWKANVSGLLPRGVGSLAQDAANRTYTITINWDDNRDGDVNTDDPNFRMTLRL